MKAALSLAALSLIPSLTLALPSPASHSHSDSDYAFLPRRENIDPSIERLFQRRQNAVPAGPTHSAPAPSGGGGVTSTGYPQEDVPGPTPKQEWVQAYQAAKAAGLIPSFAPSVLDSTGNPVYTGVDGNGPTVCSWTISKCTTGDVTDAPAGMTGLTFDDGPQPPTATLLPFLKSVNQTVTHFMIGSRILDNMQLFKQAVAQQHHIALHTWSHPYMTTMTDMQLLGEFGWTMQIIYDNSGLLPAWWRPPYGDVDARVRAIAKYVFGLTTVIWNQDTNDWCLDDQSGQGSSCPPAPGTPQNIQQLLTELRGFYNGPKTPGLIILEHELAMRPVQAFIQIWPMIKGNGWIPKTIPELFGASWYQNAPDGTTPPTPASHGILPTPSSPFLANAIPSANAIANPSASSASLAAASSASAAASAASASASSSANAAPSARPSSSASRTTVVGSVVVAGAIALFGLVMGL